MAEIGKRPAQPDNYPLNKRKTTTCPARTIINVDLKDSFITSDGGETGCALSEVCKR